MSQNRHREESMKRRGSTLVEVVVVIAIILILSALLIPACQAVRHAATKIEQQKSIETEVEFEEANDPWVKFEVDPWNYIKYNTIEVDGVKYIVFLRGEKLGTYQEMQVVPLQSLFAERGR